MSDPSSTLQSILETASDAIVAIDAAGRILTWNPRAEALFGYRYEEMRGELLTRIIPARFREAHDAGIARVAGGGEQHVIGQTVELAAVHRDGREFPIELSLGRWTSDGASFFSGIIRDITERTALAREVAESKARMQSILETANDAVVAIDGAGRILMWNPRAEVLFGYSFEEMRGESLARIIPERFREGHDSGVARVAAGGERHVIGQTVELAAVHRDGREFPVELSLGHWTGDGESFFSGIIRDITERTALSREVDEAKARMQSILETANDAVVAIDAAGRILMWNPRAEVLFGYTSEEMRGEPLTRIIPEQFRDGHDAGIARVASGGERHVIGQTVELAAVHRDGREFPIELSLGHWTSGGQSFFSGIIRDITERHRATEEIRRTSADLADKNEMLEGLSAKLAKYLSRNVYESIFEGRTEVTVQSYRKNLTVFFSDIQGFTELADMMEAEALSGLLNQYLKEMATIAEGCGGTVDKFMGDGIMIFFGDPDSRGEQEDAIACVRMAIAMRDRIAQLKNEWRRQTGATDLHVRMGINTGYCTVGNFGSDDRLDYTIVGREVNLASRLETAAEPDQILIAHRTWSLIKDEIPCVPVGDIIVKGFAYPVRTYAVGIEGSPAERASMSASAHGFSLTLDAARLHAEDADSVRRTLQQALSLLEGHDG